MNDDIPVIKPPMTVEPKFGHKTPWILVAVGIVGLLIAFFTASPAEDDFEEFEEYETNVSVTETEE